MGHSVQVAFQLLFNSHSLRGKGLATVAFSATRNRGFSKNVPSRQPLYISRYIYIYISAARSSGFVETFLQKSTTQNLSQFPRKNSEYASKSWHLFAGRRFASMLSSPNTSSMVTCVRLSVWTENTHDVLFVFKLEKTQGSLVSSGDSKKERSDLSPDRISPTGLYEEHVCPRKLIPKHAFG